MLASSSAGNSTFLRTTRTRILIDAGLSRKETFARLQAIGEDPLALDGIVITHEHSDHVSGLPVLARSLRQRPVPVFLTHLTAPMIDWADFIPPVETFQAGTRLVIGDIELGSFTTPHDAVDPVGFLIRAEGMKLGVVTDLGYIPDSIKYHVRSTDLLLLESNHDIEMLRVGPYPWSVKQRVMGRKGHLSNDVVSEFIERDLDSSTGTLVLGHISEQNNYPDLVRLVATQALERRGLRTELCVVDPRKQTPVFEF